MITLECCRPLSFVVSPKDGADPTALRREVEALADWIGCEVFLLADRRYWYFRRTDPADSDAETARPLRRTWSNEAWERGELGPDLTPCPIYGDFPTD